MKLDEKYSKAFTLVFKGDIRSFKQNPLTTETPWGIPYGASLGDLMEENNELRDLLEARGDDD